MTDREHEAHLEEAREEAACEERAADDAKEKRADELEFYIRQGVEHAIEGLWEPDLTTHIIDDEGNLTVTLTFNAGTWETE